MMEAQRGERAADQIPHKEASVGRIRALKKNRNFITESTFGVCLMLSINQIQDQQNEIKEAVISDSRGCFIPE